MPRRKVKLDVKVAAMRESLQLMNVAEVVSKHGLSKQAVYNWYREILEALPDILADDKPGRKPKSKADSAPPF
jgi:ACT domain-containing protein